MGEIDEGTIKEGVIVEKIINGGLIEREITWRWVIIEERVTLIQRGIIERLQSGDNKGEW